MRRQIIVGFIGAFMLAACGGRDAAKVSGPETPAPATPTEVAPPAEPDPVAEPGPAPFVLTAEECRSAAARSYTLMMRYDPAKLTAKQKQDVDAYAAAMEPDSIEACRRNSREWYECKMEATEHFEAEDCNTIDDDGGDDEDLP